MRTPDLKQNNSKAKTTQFTRSSGLFQDPAQNAIDMAMDQPTQLPYPIIALSQPVPEYLQQVMYALLRGDSSRCYMVGSFVRTLLANHFSDDIDLVSNLSQNAVYTILQALFPREYAHIRKGGSTHPLVVIRFADKNIRRIEVSCGHRLTPTLAADAQGRDFTLNCIYMTWRGEIEDATGQGLNDLFSPGGPIVRFADNNNIKEKPHHILRTFPLIINMWNDMLCPTIDPSTAITIYKNGASCISTVDTQTLKNFDQYKRKNVSNPSDQAQLTRHIIDQLLGAYNLLEAYKKRCIDTHTSFLCSQQEDIEAKPDATAEASHNMVQPYSSQLAAPLAEDFDKCALECLQKMLENDSKKGGTINSPAAVLTPPTAPQTTAEAPKEICQDLLKLDLNFLIQTDKNGYTYLIEILKNNHALYGELKDKQIDLSVYFRLLDRFIDDGSLSASHYKRLFTQPNCADRSAFSSAFAGSTENLLIFLAKAKEMKEQEIFTKQELDGLFSQRNNKGYSLLDEALMAGQQGKNLGIYFNFLRSHILETRELTDEEYVTLLTSPSPQGFSPLDGLLKKGDMGTLQAYITLLDDKMMPDALCQLHTSATSTTIRFSPLHYAADNKDHEAVFDYFFCLLAERYPAYLHELKKEIQKTDSLQEEPDQKQVKDFLHNQVTRYFVADFKVRQKKKDDKRKEAKNNLVAHQDEYCEGQRLFTPAAQQMKSDQTTRIKVATIQGH